MNKYISILLLCFLPFTSHAQISAEGGTQKQLRVMNASDYIKLLHDNVLLVRLKTKQSSILALESNGQTEKAEKIRLSQEVKNKSIVYAFKQHFDFCHVYFFMDKFSKEIRLGELEKVDFVNDSLEADANINPEIKDYLLAEFAIVSPDMEKFYDSDTDPNSSHEERVQRYTTGPGGGYEALIIKDQQYNQLRRPFPYYVKTYQSIPMRRNNEKVVKKMNKKLHQYWEK